MRRTRDVGEDQAGWARAGTRSTRRLRSGLRRARSSPHACDNTCSICSSRPLVCPTLCCRIFAAAAIQVEHQLSSARQSRPGVFDLPERRRTAVERATCTRAEALPSICSIQLTRGAIKAHDLFVETDAPDIDEVRGLTDGQPQATATLPP